jgi:hypothetical protein
MHITQVRTSIDVTRTKLLALRFVYDL